MKNLIVWHAWKAGSVFYVESNKVGRLDELSVLIAVLFMNFHLFYSKYFGGLWVVKIIVAGGI